MTKDYFILLGPNEHTLIWHSVQQEFNNLNATNKDFYDLDSYEKLFLQYT